MAEQALAQKERLEDVFQDEIIGAFVSITEFKKFARSKNGLCLDDRVIQSIVEDHERNVEEQKLQILNKWREIKGEKATAPKIRDLLQKYFRKDNPSGYIDLGNGIFGVYKTCFLCKKSNVYLGVQTSEVTGTQTRAIKFVSKSENTMREAQILVKLGSHVNVVSIIHAGIYHADLDDYIYIAMEHSWTRTVRNLLEDCIKEEKTFHEFNAWNLVEQLMKAVEFLHSHNIIHRDLKPENVLSSDDWKFFKVTDFGLSKEIQDGSATNQTNANTGTEGYRSRETYDPDAQITVKVDVFSAGVTIGEIMANGKHPFGEDHYLRSHNIINNNNLDLRHLCNKDQVISLIKPMLEMDPEKRPTAKKVLNEVSRLFQTFKLNNQQTKTDELSLTSSKAITKLAITERVLTGTTADESLPRASKAMTKLSITEKVLAGTTADESLPRKKEKVNAIIMFNGSDEHLLSYKLTTKKWSRMQDLPEYDLNDLWFTAVVSSKHIYVLQHQKFHQLEYSDPAAEWKKMSSMRGDYGVDPQAAVLNGFIYVCGSANDASRSVERYDAAQDRWEYICVMKKSRKHLCVVATEDHIYCMGGADEDHGILPSVERFDERLNKWEIVEPAPRLIQWATAAVVKNRIYVADCDGILCYDIQNNSWSEIKLRTRWPFLKRRVVKILAVDDELYIIGPILKNGKKFAIYLLNLKTKQMTLVETFKDKYLRVRTCLAVKLQENF